MVTKIITHNGNAHFDEFLAVALILARHEDTHFTIERRDPTEDELNDPKIWVVDIGHRYEPHLKNFDHHQDINIPASFIIVADYLELKGILEKNIWWDFKDKMDRRGSYKLAEEFALESLDPMISPLENFMLKVFAEDPMSVYHFAKAFAEKLIENGYKLNEQLAFWASCEQVTIKNKKVLIGHTDNTAGSVQYCETLDKPPHILVNYDGRGDGWSMSTIKDSNEINFYRLESNDLIKFAHKNGFIAKTKTRITLQEVIDLIEKAII